MELVHLLGWHEIVLRFVSAMIVGALLGLNRELRGKPAGLRTNALVCLGSALFVMSSMALAPSEHGNPDPSAVSRVIQGVVTGIGFLGAGVILRETSGTRIHGLTTAAAIWLTSALGIMCGLGLWPVAGVAVLLTLAILILSRPVERFLHKRFPVLTEEHHSPHDRE